MDFNKFAKTLLNDPTAMANFNSKIEETKHAQEELDILFSLIYEKNFISIGSGGLVKVITKGTKMIEQIMIDDAMLDDKGALSISIQNCINKNILDIDTEITETQKKMIEKYPVLKEFSGQI